MNKEVIFITGNMFLGFSLVTHDLTASVFLLFLSCMWFTILCYLMGKK